MKFFLITIFVLVSCNICYSQIVYSDSVPKKHLSLEESIKYVQGLELDNKKNAFYQVKYDVNLYPYIEITYLNKTNKNITTFLFDYEYRMNGVEYGNYDVKLYKNIKPKERGKFILKLSRNEYMKYSSPDNFNFEKLVLKRIRFSDGNDLVFFPFEFVHN